MTTDKRPGKDENERAAESVREALFAADMKRLVRASQEDDEERVAEVRAHYSTN